MTAVYDRLPGEGFIRLLHVEAATSRGQTTAYFVTVPVEKNEIEYTAVSYTWADPSPVTYLQLQNGQSLPLSQTLMVLFEALQRRQRVFTLWVDALCIHQEDLAEKASQVKIMGKIYSLASRVLLWLGESSPGSKSAFRFMTTKQNYDWKSDWGGEKVYYPALDDVFDLFARPWFRRAWVVQEVTLNENIDIVCGEDCIDFEDLRHSVFAVWKSFRRLNEMDDDNPALLGLWSITRIIFIRDNFQAAGAVRYETLLEAAFHLQATVKQDMVFALRGIADKARPVPEPDYTMPVDHLYRETARALLCYGNSLDLLTLCGLSQKREPEMPTWCPDLRFYSFLEPLVASERAGWHAGGDLRESPAIISKNELRIQLRDIDVVDVVCPVFRSRSAKDQQIAIRAVIALRERLPRDIPESTWTMSLASSLIFGLNIEDMPTGSNNKIYFREWLTWLQTSTCQEDIEKIRDNEFHRTIGMRIDNWKAFMTKGGFFCLGPQCIEVGDILTTVPGCRLPLIMRGTRVEVEAGSEPRRLLVGWCFAEGVMFGEAMTLKAPWRHVILT